MRRWIRWSDELSQADYALVGKKCANWGEMAKIGMPVPLAFALTVEAYCYFMEKTGLRTQINELLDSYGGGLKDYTTSLEVSRSIRNMIDEQAIPKEITVELLEAYEELSAKSNQTDVAVSVRSSGPVSRPGQFESYLNIHGKEELCRKVVSCWSSTFTVQALGYRLNRDLPIAEEPIGVGVMLLVDSRAAGVSFTVDPATGERDKIVIEGSWGLGESVVGGRVSPDRYVLSKGDLSIISSQAGEKGIKIVTTSNGVQELEVDGEERKRLCLDKEELQQIARLSIRLEEHFGLPQDVEWTVANNLPLPESISLLQTRAVAGLGAAPRPGWQRRATEGTATDHIIELMLRRVFQITSPSPGP